jgi:hypothetical protein
MRSSARRSRSSSSARTAVQPFAGPEISWPEPPSRGLDLVAVVTLDVDRRARLAGLAPLLQPLDRNHQPLRPLGEAEPPPGLAADLVGRRDVERQRPDPGVARTRGELCEQHPRHPLAAAAWDDVDDVDVGVPTRIELAEGVPDRPALVLRDEHELALEQRGRDVGRAPRPVPVLVEDRPREVEQNLLVGAGGLADVHAVSLRPVSR